MEERLDCTIEKLCDAIDDLIDGAEKIMIDGYPKEERISLLVKALAALIEAKANLN